MAMNRCGMLDSRVGASTIGNVLLGQCRLLLPCSQCATGNVTLKRNGSRNSPFRNADTRNIQEAINRQKQLQYMDTEAVHKKGAGGSEKDFFDNVDIPPTPDTLGSLVSPYVPSANQRFILTPKGLQQRWQRFKTFILSTYSIGIIKRNVKPFPVRQFALAAQDMYIKTNQAVLEMDKHALRELTTANISWQLRRTFNAPSRVLTWQFVRAVERPRVVQARIAPLQTKENFFAQVTVRMHTERIFALKNRYGRLLDGSEEPRSVVEYVVFERHIVNPYGQWRICGKLFAEEAPEENKSTMTVTEATAT